MECANYLRVELEIFSTPCFYSNRYRLICHGFHQSILIVDGNILVPIDHDDMRVLL